MKKQEFIERYGEEAWKTFLDKMKTRNRKYKSKNREKLAEKQRQYYRENKEDILVKNRKRYSDNHERNQERHSEYYLKHKDEIREKSHRYYNENKDGIREKRMDDQNKKAKSLISAYKSSDSKYNRSGFNLTKDWMIEHIFNSCCVYCGESDWHNLGCDRIDNTKAHTTNNVVCACKACNLKRGSTISFQEFLLSQNPSGASEVLSSLGL